MKIHVISDLHVDAAGSKLGLPGGETLFVVGDIADIPNICPDLTKHRIQESHQTYTLEGVLRAQEKAGNHLDNLRAEFAKYDRTFIVAGNHDSYHIVMNDAPGHLQRLFPAATVLDNELVQIGENRFVFGGAMWTDFNKDPWVTWQSRQYINDFNLMKFRDSEGMVRRWHPEDSVAMSAKFDRDLALVLGRLRDMGPNIHLLVATHYAPSWQSIHQQYRSSNMNGCFFQERSKTIYDNEMIKVWLHGHTHKACDYTVGQCRVVCNPRGYSHHENSGWDVNKVVEF